MLEKDVLPVAFGEERVVGPDSKLGIHGTTGAWLVASRVLDATAAVERGNDDNAIEQEGYG